MKKVTVSKLIEKYIGKVFEDLEQKYPGLYPDLYTGNIEKQTLQNDYFRQVLFTTKNLQLVVMCLQPGEEIGDEVHQNVDQFFRIEEGEAKFIFNEKSEYIGRDGDAVIVPQGTFHNVINIGKNQLRLYTLYSPPNHPKGTIHKTKSEAEQAEKTNTV